MAPRVYIDTNVFKFSATQLPRMVPRQQTLDWGGRLHEVVFTTLVEWNPNDSISNPGLKTEAELLPKLAELGKTGNIEYVIQSETLCETWGLPNIDSSGGRFYGTPYKKVEAPFTYGRIIVGGGGDPTEMQTEFLSGITHKRFLELQRMTGAYQGEERVNRNQMLDAFHLWCAEHNHCDYFLHSRFQADSCAPAKPKEAVVGASRLPF